ncbi:heterokaryon incompatibility protein-domain-containing protein [Scleroderma yunnanense]
MRLINSGVVLDVEDKFKRSQQPDNTTNVLVELYGPQLDETKYAILSHCWGVSADGEHEVQFKEMKKLTTMNKARRDEIRNRSGYKKILGACAQAKEDGLEWVWIDTCCINKESSSELSEAINSMYHWYAKSTTCYTYLHDIDDSLGFPTNCDETRFDETNGWPKWFLRGWTLQELIAPHRLHFFDKEWAYIGDKQELVYTLNEITRIPISILEDGLPSLRPSVAQIISWASDRRTTREEDRAYSLLGLLGVHMPMLYGEGANAFRRLQLEIIRGSNDQSIFAWGWTRKTGWASSFLADDPSHFQDCNTVVKMERGYFIAALKNDAPEDQLLNPPLEQLRTFSVTNDGIQICLPLKPLPAFPRLFQAKLACYSSRSEELHPITIILAFFESTYHRYFGGFMPPSYVRMQFKQLLLPYQDEVHPDVFQFQLDSRSLFHNWTINNMVDPEETLPHSFNLSNTNDYASVVFTHHGKDPSFAVALSYRHGQLSVRVIWDPKHAQVATLEDPFDGIGSCPVSHPHTSCLVKHVHFPQSIRGVRIACGHPLSKNIYTVTIDVIECPGCCTSMWCGYNFVKDPDMPGLMSDAIPWIASVYELFIGSIYTQFLLDTNSTMRLGDYGFFQDGGSFQKEGNIFEGSLIKHAVTLKWTPTNRAICCEIGADMQSGWMKTTGFDWSNHPVNTLALYHATGLSLPNDYPGLIPLLKDLSTHLNASRCIVTTVVQCQQCYYTEELDQAIWPSDSDYAPHPDNLWKKLDTTTPLYTVMTPLVWCQQVADWETRKKFREIR